MENNIPEIEKEKKTFNYIFPDVLGKAMSNVPINVQLEASMMSMFLMMIGLMISAVYVGFYVNFPLWYKILLEINFFAGFIFMSSFLITTFQTYQNVMEVADFQKTERRENGKDTI